MLTLLMLLSSRAYSTLLIFKICALTNALFLVDVCAEKSNARPIALEGIGLVHSHSIRSTFHPMRKSFVSNEHPLNLGLTSLPINLPSNFPDVETPLFLYGDRLRWIPDGNHWDWGIVIGRFYSFAPHRRSWAWCYLIWLDQASPSSAWTSADTAWENDLEPMEGEETL